MNHNTSPSLAPTTEIVAAIILDSLPAEEIRQLKADAKVYIYARTNVEIGDNVKIHIANNTPTRVALALPYYGRIEKARAEILKETEIQNIIGGEIVISLLIGSLVGGAIGIVASGSAAAITVGSTVGAVVGAGIGVAALATTAGVLTTKREKGEI